MNLLPRKFNPREKLLVTSFGVIILFLLSQQIFLKPIRRDLSQLRFKKIKFSKKMQEIQESFPNIENQVSKIEKLRNEGNLLVRQIQGVEQKLMSKEDIPRLLGAINTLGAQVNIVSIKQRIEESPELSKLYVEVIFTAPFQQALTYINNIETVLSLLNIEKLDISRNDKNILNEITSVMLLSTILEPRAPRKTFNLKEASKEFSVKNDLFFSAQHKIASQTSNIDLKLEGVTYSPKNPIAIINGDVYKLNSTIQGFTVEKILPDKVVLVREGREYILQLE